MASIGCASIGSLVSTEALAKSSEQVKIFNSVAELKLSALSVSEYAMTLGYYEPGDNGGAVYKINNPSNSFDGFGSHQLSNNNIATLTSGSESGAKVVKLEQFGMKSGDKSKDYVHHLNAALNYADTILLSGSYFVSNVILPNKHLTLKSIGEKYSAGFVACDSIDGSHSQEYFVAPSTWVDNGDWVNAPVKMYGITLDAGPSRQICLVVRFYFGVMEDLTITNGSQYGLYMTAKNSEGGVHEDATMVNNVFRNLKINGSSKVGMFVDEDGKSTDWMLDNGFIYNKGLINLSARTLAGAHIRGVHFYDSETSMELHKFSTGTIIEANYCEGGVTIKGGIAGHHLTFGPANYLKKQLRLDYSNVNNAIKSVNNTLKSVRHNYWGDRKFYSINDTLTSSSPFSFMNNGRGNRASIRVKHAMIGFEQYSGELSPAKGMSNSSALINDF